MSIIIKGHEGWRRRRLPGLAAPDALLLHPARRASFLGRGVRALPRPVPRPSSDRAGAAGGHEPPRRDLVLRCLQRHRAGGPPGGARPRPAPARARRPSREGPRPHPDRIAAARAAPPADDGPAAAPFPALLTGAAGAGADAGAARRRVGLTAAP